MRRDEAHIHVHLLFTSMRRDEAHPFTYYASMRHMTKHRVVFVLTFTHRHNTMQSVVAGQAPMTLEWNNTSGVE